eukprot:symbB.v1.2.025286.t2/scaffold2445.1/size151041/14
MGCVCLEHASSNTFGFNSRIHCEQLDANECWIGEFNEDFCCGDEWGLTGNPTCWNEEFSYLRCCGLEKLPRKPEEDQKWEKIKAGKDLEDGGEYDFIIVGAGSAGSVVASRLADAETVDGQPYRVLILEAGSWADADDEAHPDRSTQKQEAWWPAVEANWSLGKEGRTWKYATGRGVGGTASVNSMIYTRGSVSEYEAFGWSTEEVISAFKSLEAPMEAPGFQVSPEFHRPLPQGAFEEDPDEPGCFLTLVSAFLEELPPVFRQLIRAFERIKVPFRVDPHGNITIHGVGGTWRSMGCGHPRCQPNRLPRVQLAGGRPRSTTYQNLASHLRASPAHRLQVTTHAYAERIVFEGNKAVGVEVSIAKNPKAVDRRLRFRVKKEVILATGVLATPKLLTLSGIAEPKELERLDVPVVASSPSVSRHFHEHVGLSIVAHTNVPCPDGFHLSEDGKTTTHLGNTDQFIGQLYAFLNATNNVPGAAGPVMLLEGCLEGHLTLTFTVILLQARTRGRLVVQSRNPFASPHLDYKPLSNTEDIQVLVNTIRLLYQGVFASPDLAAFELGVSPGMEVVADFSKLAQWIRANIYYYSHPTGTVQRIAALPDTFPSIVNLPIGPFMAAMAFSASSSELFQPPDSDVDEPRYAQSYDELESNLEPSGSSGNAMASAVAKEVLSATDQYALLGADRDACEMDLRRCFLRRGVEVYPRDRSGNSVPSHAEAFCKVAAAWTELRDLGSRWRYDMELQAGRGNLSSSSPLPHKPPPMDVEKALGIFAFETWVCGKNTLPLQDFEPVLREAQELVDNSKEIAPLPDSEVTPTTVACGMAVSAGLLAAGCVASAAGYPTLGNYVRKGAVYQGTGLIQGGQQEVSTERGPQDDPWNLLFGGMSCIPCQRSCLFKAGKIITKKEKRLDHVEDQDSDEDARIILPGDTVRIIRGLQGLQGRLGEVIKALSKGAFQIRLRPPAVRYGAEPEKRGKVINVNKRNLELANDNPFDGAREGAPISSSQTARVERPGQLGVVDSQLRVLGTQNLRVADTSIFPESPSGHSDAPARLAGEICARSILSQTRERTYKEYSGGPSVQLRGYPLRMPLCGFGTNGFQGDRAKSSLRSFFQLGGRMIDTALLYENHRDIGQALAAGTVFIVTKIPPTEMGTDETYAAVLKAVEELGTPVDLVLLHWPANFDKKAPLPPCASASSWRSCRLQAWRGLERAQTEGKVRALGVSNFGVRHLTELLADGPSLPIAVNQVEMHPWWPQLPLQKFCREKHIKLIAYGSLGSSLLGGATLRSPAVVKVAKRRGRSPAQVLLRWAVQQGIAVIPFGAYGFFVSCGYGKVSDDLELSTRSRNPQVRDVQWLPPNEDDRRGPQDLQAKALLLIRRLTLPQKVCAGVCILLMLVWALSPSSSPELPKLRSGSLNRNTQGVPCLHCDLPPSCAVSAFVQVQSWRSSRIRPFSRQKMMAPGSSPRSL